MRVGDVVLAHQKLPHQKLPHFGVASHSDKDRLMMVYFRLTQRTIEYGERRLTAGPFLTDLFFPFPPVRARARG